jgi:hypothetical protein
MTKDTADWPFPVIIIDVSKTRANGAVLTPASQPVQLGYYDIRKQEIVIDPAAAKSIIVVKFDEEETQHQ